MRHADCSLWNSLPEDLGAAESALHIHVSLTFVRILRVVHRPYLIYSLILLYIVKSFTFFFYLMCHPFYCLFLFHFVCFSPAFFFIQFNLYFMSFYYSRVLSPYRLVSHL